MSYFATRASDLLCDTRLFVRRHVLQAEHEAALSIGMTQLRNTVEKTKIAGSQILAAQERIVQAEALTAKFGLDANATGLYVPARRHIEVVRTLEEARRKAITDRSALLSMSPRQFEEFMADLFWRLGYRVELTQTSRDGGTDLICLKEESGIPFRLAVEVKRYRENRPITVSLVRSFLGSNAQHRANRLLFVTTSYYTKPALYFARNYAAHELSLKQYEDIQGWCQEAQHNPMQLV